MTTEENNIKVLLHSITSSINEDFEDFAPINRIADKFNTKPSTIILPLIGIILVISLLTSFVAHFVITLFAMIYPAYMSFKVLPQLFRPSTERTSSCAKSGWPTGSCLPSPLFSTDFWQPSSSFCLHSMPLKYCFSSGCSTLEQMGPRSCMRNSWDLI